MEVDTEKFQITSQQAIKLWDKLFGVKYIVESMDYFRKREGIKYEVWHKGDDSWTCDCESWKYKSGLQTVRMLIDGAKHETCKHMRFVMVQQKMKFNVIG